MNFGLFGDDRGTFGYDCRNDLSSLPIGGIQKRINGMFRGLSANTVDLVATY